MRALVVFGMLALAATARAEGEAPPSARAEAATAGFVAARGAAFVVDGRPFAFVGANVNVVHGEAARAAYQGTLGAVRADGLTVARVWAFAEGPADAGEWWRRDHLFRAGPDGYIEESYRHLDAVLAEAGRLGLRVVLTLGNNWSDYGGIPMLLRWAGLPAGQGDADPVREAFYSSEAARAFFKGGVAHLLDRTNTVSGVRYRDDPTIFSWELLNESTVRTADGAAARRAWIAEMAGFIRARDPHHLIGAGLAGYRTRAERDEWIAVHRLPAVDYCDAHLYPERDARVGTEPALGDVVDDLAQLARFVIGKPLLIGELGFRTDVRQRWLGAPRDAWYRRALERARGDGVAGVLTWIYQPFVGSPRDFGIYTDRPDTDDVRAALRSLALTFAGAPPPDNPRLSPAQGAALLYDPRITLHGRGGAARPALRTDGDAFTLSWPAARFHQARFETAGAFPGGKLPRFCGLGAGRLTYRFRVPAGLPASPGSLRLVARLSSPAWGPGAPPPSPPAGVRVAVLLDGQPAGSFDAPADDGAGLWRTLAVLSPSLRRRLARPGVHAVAFEVGEEAGDRGLCVYADSDRRGGPRGGPITLRYGR